MKHFLMIFVLVALLSCQVGPKEIAYGEQSCYFCRMTIVDKQHAAQLVTDKGKVYNFDAAECMINYLTGFEEDAIGLLLVSDYNNPADLIKAETATFIISEDMPSPMGANLSSVTNLEEAEKLLQNKEGKMYNWYELKQYFKDL